MSAQLGKIVLVWSEDEFSLREVRAYCNDILDPLSPGIIPGQDVINARGVLHGEPIRMVFSPVFGMSDQDGVRFQRLVCTLKTIYSHGHRFTGILFAKAAGPTSTPLPGSLSSPSPVLDIFATSLLKAISGEDFFSQISVLTTGWTRPPTLDQFTIEARALIHPDRLAPLVSSGASISRLQTRSSSTPQDTDAFIHALGLLLENPPRALALQEETSQQGKLRAHETTAGRILHRRLDEEYQRVGAQLRALIPSPTSPTSRFPDPLIPSRVELEARIRTANDIIADRTLEVTALREELTIESANHAAIVSNLESEVERLKVALSQAEAVASARTEEHKAEVKAMRDEGVEERVKAKQRHSALEAQIRDIQSKASNAESTRVAAAKSAEKELTRAKNETNAIRIDKEKTQGELDALKSKTKEFNTSQKKVFDQLHKDLAEKTAEVARLNTQIEKLKSEATKAGSELSSCKSRLEKAQESLKEIRSSHATVEAEYRAQAKQAQAQLDDEMRRSSFIRESHMRHEQAQNDRLKSLEDSISRLADTGEENRELRSRVERLGRELEEGREQAGAEASRWKASKEKFESELRRMRDVESSLEAQIRDEQRVHGEEIEGLKRALREAAAVTYQQEVPGVTVSLSGWDLIYNGLRGMF